MATGRVATMTGSVVVDVPEQRYRVTFLGGSADSSDALAINERGTIVGWTAAGGPNPQAAMWRNGQLQLLADSGTYLTSRAKDVNSQDVAALELRRRSTPNCGEAAIWRSDVLTFIATGRCDVTDVASINDSSAVVGDALYVHPDGSASVVAHARDINDRGQVVGRWDDFYPPYAYPWEQNVSLPFPLPRGLNCGYQGNHGHFDIRFERINDRGQAIGVGALVTGYVLSSDSSLVATPTGAPTNAVDLSLALGGAIPSALNNAGVVVAARDGAIYLWSRGRTTTLRLDDATWHVDAISGINDQGQHRRSRDQRVDRPTRRDPPIADELIAKFVSSQPHPTNKKPARATPSNESPPGSYAASPEQRTGRDSNSRYRCRYAGFRDRCLQPLGHLSRTAVELRP